MAPIGAARGGLFRPKAAAAAGGPTVTDRDSYTQTTLATTWSLGNANYPVGATAAYLAVVSESAPSGAWTATLGGVSMTELVAARIGASNRTSLFYILASTIPAGGINRAIVLTSVNSISGYARFWATTGGVQAAPLATAGEGTTSPLTVTDSSVGLNSLLLAIVASNTTGTTAQTDVTLTSGSGTWANQFKNSGAAGLHWGVFGDRIATAAGSYDAIVANVGGTTSARRFSLAIVEIP